MNTQLPRLSVKEVTRRTWADFDALFSAKGSPGYCWCMAWRATAAEKRSRDPALLKQAMKARVDGQVPVGLLGYLDAQPVAWCSVAPGTSFRGLRKDVAASGEVWAITCFFVRREHRGQGLAKALLQAAVEHARRRGAKAVEGYPVDADSPSYRFMGFVPLFEQAGFSEVARAGTRRHVVSKPLGL
ncbi:MAG: GNAT family N-acetyltransferase [Rubrivivax sp.]